MSLANAKATAWDRFAAHDDSQVHICKYALNNSYAYNLHNRRLTAHHGIIKIMLVLTYYYNYGQNAEEWGVFDGAYKELKSAGWDKIYLKKDLESIFDDITECAEFIDQDELDTNTHVYARL